MRFDMRKYVYIPVIRAKIKDAQHDIEVAVMREAGLRDPEIAIRITKAALKTLSRDIGR